jgi:hypothetical protein
MQLNRQAVMGALSGNLVWWWGRGRENETLAWRKEDLRGPIGRDLVNTKGSDISTEDFLNPKS